MRARICFLNRALACAHLLSQQSPSTLSDGAEDTAASETTHGSSSEAEPQHRALSWRNGHGRPARSLCFTSHQSGAIVHLLVQGNSATAARNFSAPSPPKSDGTAHPSAYSPPNACEPMAHLYTWRGNSARPPKRRHCPSLHKWRDNSPRWPGSGCSGSRSTRQPSRVDESVILPHPLSL